MYVIALIGIGLVLHGFILLCFAAFRAKPSWGLAVLLVPFAQVFFPVYYWDQARKPFMTFTLGMALWLGTAVVFGQGPLDKYWLDQISLVQSAEQIFNGPYRQKPLSLEERAEQLVNSNKNRMKPKAAKSPKVKIFSAQNSPNYIGYNVRITLNNGNIRNGRIISAGDGVVELQFTIDERTIGDKTISDRSISDRTTSNRPKGTMTYELVYEDIKSIEIAS